MATVAPNSLYLYRTDISRDFYRNDHLRVFYRTHAVDVKEVTYSSPKLPSAFDGYRIVQLSDIHIGSWQGNASAIQKLVKLVNEQQADLIVFTGDLVNHRAVELNDFKIYWPD